MRKLLGLASLVVLLWSTGTAGQQPVFTPFGIIPVLDPYLESLRQQTAIPGMSAALVRDGVVQWEKGYGFQNVAARVRATPDTPYLIGDAAGTLASILLLQCVEQRHLELDRPLGLYGIQVPDGNATLRQVLSHTNTDPEAEPFLYNLERYSQLDRVLERCAPQAYRKSIAHRILNRLAMVDSVPGTDLKDPEVQLEEGLFEPADLERYRRVLTRLATPYKVDGRGRTDVTQLPPMAVSSVGGLVSTVRDLAKLDGALDADVLLLEETTAQAWQPVVHRGVAVPTGLGWFVQSYRGQRIVWTFGVVPNAYSSLIIKLPERNITLILLANSDRLNSPFMLQQGDLTRSLFAQLFLKLVT